MLTPIGICWGGEGECYGPPYGWRWGIEGNTDSIGTDLYNLGLGQRCTEVVMGYLVLRHQVDPKRMTPLSYGESRPIADNRTAEGRALNRRVEFKVLVR